MRVRATEERREPSVSERTIETRALLTIDEGHGKWFGRDLEFEPGTIVRLIPPAGLPDSHVESTRRELLDCGAARVKVVRRRAPLVLKPERREQRSPRASARETVMRMASEARTVDRPALVALLDARLTEQGI